MKKNKYIWWLVVFGVMFMSGFLLQGIATEGANMENRSKEELPKLATSTYKEYPKLVENYFNDRLPYRDVLIRMYGSVVYYGFREASSNRVIVGKEGWLFYNETISDYKRVNLYTKAQLIAISKNLEEVQGFLNSLNIKFVLFIAPNKSSIYGEFLPEYIKVQESVSRTEQLTEYLKQNTDITVVFPEDELIKMKEKYPEYPLYMHLDTHWNSLGGYYGAKTLLNELNIDIPDIKKIDLEKKEEPVFHWQGYDLVNLMGMTGILKEDINFNIDGYSKSIVEWHGNPAYSKEDFEGICRTTSNASDKRKVVFIRDSFGTSMLPVIAACFEEVYSPHEGYCSRKKVNLLEEQPDIVIYEMVERGELETKNILNQFEVP